MGNIMQIGMISLAALLGVSQVAFYVFDDSYTVTPYRVAVSVLVTLLPILVSKLMGAADDHKGRELDRMTADLLAKHQKENR
ncbi:hypothetical protein [Pseudomonas sp. P108]|uniref:hypothetical protein n=1 Tax=Pseudomonas sp. P108 TaxID=1837993 RepID=UPI002935228E|nr:hypothetical protein [Pseudomonas sp. P108]WNZ87429.1 hypothetical protein QOM10_29540 [Pseudomonas sp. P108]